MPVYTLCTDLFIHLFFFLQLFDSELGLNVKGNGNPITFGGIISDEEDTKAGDPIHQLQPSMSFSKNHLEPVPGHSSSAEVVAGITYL